VCEVNNREILLFIIIVADIIASFCCHYYNFCFSSCTGFSPNAALVLCIRKAPSSNLDPETDTPH
jgi:hypothetical protein